MSSLISFSIYFLFDLYDLIFSSFSLTYLTPSVDSSSFLCKFSLIWFKSFLKKSLSYSSKANFLLYSFDDFTYSLVKSFTSFSLFLISSFYILVYISNCWSFSVYSQFSFVFNSSISILADDNFSYKIAFSVLYLILSLSPSEILLKHDSFSEVSSYLYLSTSLSADFNYSYSTLN